MPTFERYYKARELNRAKGMKFHPVTRAPIAKLLYNRERAEFYEKKRIEPILWEYEGDSYEIVWQAKIGTGKAMHKPGDAYPKHWNFDPFTGEHLDIGQCDD